MRVFFFVFFFLFCFISFSYEVVGSFKYNFAVPYTAYYWSYTPMGSNAVTQRGSLTRSGTDGVDLVFSLNKRYFVKLYCGGYSNQHTGQYYRLIFNAGGIPSGGYSAADGSLIKGEWRITVPYNSPGWFDSPVFYFAGNNNSMQIRFPMDAWGVGYIYMLDDDATVPPDIDLKNPTLPDYDPDVNPDPPIPDDSDIDPEPDNDDDDDGDDEKDSITVPPGPEEPEIKPLDPMKPIFDRYKGVDIKVPGQGNFLYPRFGIPLPNDQVVHVGIADGLSNSDISDSFSFIQDIVKGLGYVLISVVFFKSTFKLFRKNG